MSISSLATYSQGVLLLPEPLELPEGTKVWLNIQTNPMTDPLAKVIGIGESGRHDGAGQHDDYLKPKVA